MIFSEAFEIAINRVMIYEVGPFWKLTPEVEAGLINTVSQRKAVGYVNDKDDTGGETKFGVAANHNPKYIIKTLTWEQAKGIYFKKYWLAAKCDVLPTPLAILHFDCAVNHGVERANIFLQRAAGVKDDGKIGPITLTKVLQSDVKALCKQIKEQRNLFYQRIVANNPSQEKFLKGWLSRSKSITEYVLSL